MLAELTKKASLQQLYTFGHFTGAELRELKKDGWRVVWQDKPKAQQNRNGIPVGRAV